MLNRAIECFKLRFRSISTVYRAVCGLTRKAVIIKAYQKSKMKEKNFLRMEREIRLMRQLEADPSIVQVSKTICQGRSSRSKIAPGSTHDHVGF
jgi:hypothetical protein